MFEPFNAVQFFRRFQGVAFDVGVEFFQPARDPHDGPACADAGYEVRDPALGLFPDFPGGRIVMGFPVGVVVVLVRHEIAARIFVVYFLRQVYGPVGTFKGT